MSMWLNNPNNNLLAGPLVELELAIFTVFICVLAGAPAGCWILQEQALSPPRAVIATWLTNTGQEETDRDGREGERG